MKKILAILLAACLLLMTGAALAQTVKLLEVSDTFDLEVDVPEGVTIEQDILEGQMSLIHVRFADPAHAQYTVLISFSEEHVGRMMSELTDEEIDDLIGTIGSEMQNPSHEVKVLEDGIKMMVVQENEGSDYAYVLTIYDGYFIQMYIAHDDYATLTDEEVDAAITMMDNVHVLPPA